MQSVIEIPHFSMLCSFTRNILRFIGIPTHCNLSEAKSLSDHPLEVYSMESFLTGMTIKWIHQKAMKSWMRISAIFYLLAPERNKGSKHCQDTSFQGSHSLIQPFCGFHLKTSSLSYGSFQFGHICWNNNLEFEKNLTTKYSLIFAGWSLWKGHLFFSRVYEPQCLWRLYLCSFLLPWGHFCANVIFSSPLQSWKLP